MTTVFEKALSRPVSAGSQNSYRRECVIFDAADEEAAMVAMLNDALFPVTIDFNFDDGTGTRTYIRDKAGVNPIEDAGASGSTHWEGWCDYVMFARTPYQPGESAVNFEIGFQSVNVKWALATPDSASILGGAATDVGQLINFDGETVQGVDLDVPTFTWSETHILANASVTAAYFATLWAISKAPVNDDAFRGFAAGEVRFLGVQGTRRYKNGDYELNFKFAASENQSSLQIGDDVALTVTKDGWEYVWAKYGWDVTGTVRLLIATDVYVNKVYNTSNFAGLGIGTASLLG